ncbi:Na+/H+ antiporter NhaA [Asticcacaulis sp. DW145]|uniref:Na(+)/H(+) antiporter NhaA n=1 Tax=Asticcacaulis currens TaxID=2984210 RepID=A0ABT5IC29_9CAUL|nr:Na+/H+ antiporter NhaA [Asticcacaulis currens]MDC7693741.1 Na+/H+ antiporter NhaA [Asticcacaulis currens]BEV10298.1 Na+/H+ antiporter NhaA [Asticcacaulis sp. DW145]
MKFTLEFLKTEAGAGFILGLSALIAVIWANSPWAAVYFDFINAHIPVQIGTFVEDKSVLKWTKEGLMAIFFFVVGLEIKYEIFRGELSNPKKLALPVLGAIGGMAAPALVYVALNAGLPGGDLRGWSVPMATDIAFALAVFAVVGRGLPDSLRVFLLTLAIVDDLGAVLVIGLFYSSGIDLLLCLWIAGLLVIMGLAKYALRNQARGLKAVYLVLFIATWAFSLKAGLATSLTAVAAAFMVTLDAPARGEESLLKTLMHDLHTPVSYGIVPFFAFVASGFSFAGMSFASLGDPRMLGVALGLFVGKQVGVFGLAWLAIRLKIARAPENSGWGALYGVSLLCGIGFTMSLFLGALAFADHAESAQNAIKLGVITGSLLSACAGAIVLSRRRVAS